MPAHVEQRMDATIICPNDNDGSISDLISEIISGPGYATHVTGTKPVVREHFLYVFIINKWIGVELPFKRPQGTYFVPAGPPPLDVLMLRFVRFPDSSTLLPTRHPAASTRLSDSCKRTSAARASTI